MYCDIYFILIYVKFMISNEWIPISERLIQINANKLTN